MKCRDVREDGSQSLCGPAIGGSIVAYLSLASGELNVHETTGVLEPLHGTALTAQLLVSVCKLVACGTISQPEIAGGRFGGSIVPGIA